MTARIPLHQVDAFTDRPFAGNPAAVCPLEAWLPDETLQAIAAENNLSETAFFVPRDGEPDAYDLRWFTPAAEVPLCGHATLASAHVLFERDPALACVRFQTRESGPLEVTRDGDLLAMDFPSAPPGPCDPPDGLIDALGEPPDELLKGTHYYMAVYGREADVAALAPDFPAVARAGAEVIVTAPGDAADLDFVSRFFAPSLGIDEDPVTGSAHCTLTPYWAKRLGKSKLRARQISARGGDVFCEDRGERVLLCGSAVTVIIGELKLD